MSHDTYEVIAFAVFAFICGALVKFELWRIHCFMDATHWGFWKAFFVLGG